MEEGREMVTKYKFGNVYRILVGNKWVKVTQKEWERY